MFSSYKKNKDIFNYLLTKKEKFLFLLTTSLNFFGIFLEMFSLALIIPVFNFIFFNNLPNNFLFFSIFNNLKILSEFNTKMLIVVFLIIFFCIKTFLLIIFNYLYLKFINLMSIRLSNDLYKLYIEKDFDFFLSDKSNNILRGILSISGYSNNSGDVFLFKSTDEKLYPSLYNDIDIFPLVGIYNFTIASCPLLSVARYIASLLSLSHIS